MKPVPGAIKRRHKLKTSIINCHACPLRSASNVSRPLPPRGPSPALLAIILEGPTHEDAASKLKILASPLTKEGRLLDELLLEVGLVRSQVFITAATFCPSKGLLGSKTALKEAHETCRDLYRKSVNLSGAPVAIAMGARSMKLAQGLGVYSPKTNFKACLDTAPIHSKGRTWITTHTLASAISSAPKRGHIREALEQASSAMQDVLFESAKAAFPDSSLVSRSSYVEMVDEALTHLGQALKTLPSCEDRERLLKTLLDATQDLRAHPPSRYSVRVIASLERSSSVVPNPGFQVKK